jgi:hypothetical protein
MNRLIVLESEKRKMICKHFGVTNQNLSQVLKFKRNSPNAIRMRAMALENGGKLYEYKPINK